MKETVLNWQKLQSKITRPVPSPGNPAPEKWADGTPKGRLDSRGFVLDMARASEDSAYYTANRDVILAERRGRQEAAQRAAVDEANAAEKAEHMSRRAQEATEAATKAAADAAQKAADDEAKHKGRWRK